MARSLGDTDLRPFGVIPDPDVYCYALKPNDQYLVVGSDGIWEFIGDQEVTDILSASLAAKGGLVGAACETLIMTAADRWLEEAEDGYRDDCTVVVCKLPCFGSNAYGSMRASPRRNAATGASPGSRSGGSGTNLLHSGGGGGRSLPRAR